MLSKHLSVFYVDDDPDDQYMVKETICDIMPLAQVLTANNGIDALHYLLSLSKEQLPHLIIMDMNMPRMDGREAVTHIQADHTLKNIPLVLFTTSCNVV